MRWARPRRALLLAVAACRCTAAAAGGGGAAKWWCDEDGDGGEECYLHEYSFVETCILIVLVCMALVFEAVYHFFREHVGTSYHYGQLQTGAGRRHFNSVHTSTGTGHAPGGARHLHDEYTVPLWKHWFSRLCAEIMVLGYIAFLIFITRQAGLFDGLATAFPAHSSRIHLPPTSADWLHMVELVHMKLFLGMLIYFTLVSRIVSGSVKTIRAWEEMRILRVAGAARSAMTVSHDSRLMGFENTAVKRYGRWRSYFITDVLGWRQKRPSLHREVLETLALDSLPKVPVSKLHKALDENFAFSAYLAYSVCSCTTDTVEIHSLTWIAVIFVLLVFALLHRFASVILLDVVPIFIVAAFMILGVLWRLVRSFTARVDVSGQNALSLSRRDLAAEHGGVPKLASFAERDTEHSYGLEAVDDEVQVVHEAPAVPTPSDQECWQEDLASASRAHTEVLGPDEEEAEGFHEKFSTEMHTLRLLQVILFVCSYACARTLGDPADWKSRPDQVVLVCCVFGIIFFLLGSMLPGLVPTFAALMAMPPYVDRQNADLFLAVLAEHKRPVDKAAGQKSDRKAAGLMMHHRTTEGGSMLRHRTAASLDSSASAQSPDHHSRARVLLGGSSSMPAMAFSLPQAPGDSSPSRQWQQAADAEWQLRMARQVEEIHRRLLGGEDAEMERTIRLPPARTEWPPPPEHAAAAAAPAGEPAGEPAAEPAPPGAGAPRSLLGQIAVLRRELQRLEGLVVGEELAWVGPAPAGGDEGGDVAALLRAEFGAGGGA